MYQEQRILKRIDKPLLYLTKRIRKNALALTILAAFACVTAVPERNIWYEMPALILWRDCYEYRQFFLYTIR